eukprot:TRINITY_DN8769_c0_g1_i1.p1 TRINITY_DN8769_c0_g1~~TRINITY_DN8769_c0_g1_i1.p1  ORF type:complete len:1069 (-),score=246.35 TRINITY_DN8769_c0_g1_i1:33-3239(-)
MSEDGKLPSGSMHVKIDSAKDSGTADAEYRPITARDRNSFEALKQTWARTDSISSNRPSSSKVKPATQSYKTRDRSGTAPPVINVEHQHTRERFTPEVDDMQSELEKLKHSLDTEREKRVALSCALEELKRETARKRETWEERFSEEREARQGLKASFDCLLRRLSVVFPDFNVGDASTSRSSHHELDGEVEVDVPAGQAAPGAPPSLPLSPSPSPVAPPCLPSEDVSQQQGSPTPDRFRFTPSTSGSNRTPTRAFIGGNRKADSPVPLPSSKRQQPVEELTVGLVEFGTPLTDVLTPTVVLSAMTELKRRYSCVVIKPGGTEAYIDSMFCSSDTAGTDVDDIIHRCETETCDLVDVPTHVVEAVLLQFFLSLPLPLVHSRFLSGFIVCLNITDKDLQLTVLRSLVHCMGAHAAVFTDIVRFLASTAPLGAPADAVIHHLTKVWGPVLFRPQLHGSAASKDNSNQDAVVSDVLSTIIRQGVCQENVVDISFSSEMDGSPSVVKAATFSRLLELLFDPYYRDPDFLEVFLFSYPSFCTSLELLSRLRAAFEKNSGGSKWEQSMVVRVLTLLKLWLEQYTDRLKKEEKFVDELGEFCLLLKDAKNSQAPIILGIHADMIAPPPSESPLSPRKSTPASAPPSSLSSSLRSSRKVAMAELKEIKQAEKAGDSKKARFPDLLGMKAIEVAKQLTHIDHALFCAIAIDELARKAFTKPEISPNYTAMVTQFNHWSLWVVSEIVSKPSVERRIDIFSHFVKIAEKCVELNNFNTSYAIVSGINHYAVKRMKSLRERMPRKTSARLQKLTELYDIDSNHRAYRQAVLNVKPPLVPYLGLYGKDLLVFEEEPTFQEVPGAPAKLISIAKMRRLFNLFANIRQIQKQSYSFPTVEPLFTELKNVECLTEDDAYTKSLEVEPKKGTGTAPLEKSRSRFMSGAKGVFGAIHSTRRQSGTERKEKDTSPSSSPISSSPGAPCTEVDIASPQVREHRRSRSDLTPAVLTEVLQVGEGLDPNTGEGKKRHSLRHSLDGTDETPSLVARVSMDDDRDTPTKKASRGRSKSAKAKKIQSKNSERP